MSDPVETLLVTPLNALHRALGARLVPFAGYAMPVQFPAGILAEHLHTRTKASLFDVSHMGQIRLSGPDAAASLESLVPADIIGLPAGRQRYTYFTNDAGGIEDDLMVANTGDALMLVVNASRKANDLAWLRSRIGNRCQIEPMADRALLALQGPASARVLARLVPSVAAMRFMQVAPATVDGIELSLSRSGYTGEDGFEISVRAMRSAWPNDCSPMTMLRPPAWARGIRCAWKRACVCMATISARPSHRSKPRLNGRFKKCAGTAVHASVGSPVRQSSCSRSSKEPRVVESD